jgi:class 3 adenylate cyclase
MLMRAANDARKWTGRLAQMPRPAGGALMAGRAVKWLTWVVVPLALLSFGLYLALGLSGPKVSGLAAFSPDDAVWVLGQAAFAMVGAIVASRRPELPIGWLFCVAGLLGLVEGIAARAAVYALVDTSGSTDGGAAAWLSAAVWYPHIALLVLGVLLFPSGRPPARGWWAVAWVLGAGAAVAAVGMGLLWPARGIEMLDASPGSSHAPLGTALISVALLIQAGCAAATIVALLVRLRRAQGVEREQLKWLIYAGALTVAGLLLLIPRELGLGSSVLLDFAGATLTSIGGLGIPVAVGVAILRYRLYDIDLLISRTLVYGLLTVLVTVGYLAIVVGIGTLVGSRGDQDLFLSIVATAVIAVAFQPVRERSRRLANRLVYGKRASPYEVLSEFSRGMAGASTDDSLQQMTRLVVEATGAEMVIVWLRLGELLQPQARWPTGALPGPIALDSRNLEQAILETQPGSRSFPVEHENELLGALTVTISPREPLTSASEKLITDLAAQTGLGFRFQRMKERALFARALASFLPPEVADLVEASPSALALREEVEATILFSDIRGFSSLAERLPPREVAEVVERHLAAMVDVVTSNGGVLDKFAGDALMAVFGAPRPAADQARRALTCAAAMQRRQVMLNVDAEREGLPSFEIGIGVNTGMVIAGTLGGPGRLDYTVLGDAVNIAQRLQATAAGGEVLATAATVRQWGADRAEPVGLKQLKGRQELVDTYRIRWEEAHPQTSGGTAHRE